MVYKLPSSLFHPFHPSSQRRHSTPLIIYRMKSLSILTTLATSLFTAGEAALLWDGRFNDFASAADLNKWSWSNQVSK